MKKAYFIVSIPFILGVVCFVSYAVIGSRVAENGMLIEPFWLIPVGYLMFGLSIVLGLIFGITFLVKKK